MILKIEVPDGTTNIKIVTSERVTDGSRTTIRNVRSAEYEEAKIKEMEIK